MVSLNIVRRMVPSLGMENAMSDIVIGWPELIYICLTMFGMGATIVQGNGTKIVSAFIGLAIVYPLLYWGGFFS